MRTLKLTHEQIETICHALGIAQAKFEQLHRTIIEQAVNVGGLSSPDIERKKYIHIFEEAQKFGNLNSDIKNSNLDV